MDKMNLTLDQVIAVNKNKGNNANANAAGGGKMRNKKRVNKRSGWRGGYDAAARAGHQGGEGGGVAAPVSLPRRFSVSPVSPKLLVSNLAPTVSDADVAELFSEFGAVRYSALHHDAQGQR